MDKELTVQRIRQFLETVGSRIQSPANLVLLGGSGLLMLGNRRSTLDFDYDGEEEVIDDFRDVLIRQGFVESGVLESVIEEATKKAADFDLNPGQMRTHLALAFSALTKRQE